MAELDINGPIDLSVWERNKRVYERLVKEGLVVIPVLLETSDPKCVLIDHLIVSVGPPQEWKPKGGENPPWEHSPN